jgi:hypothetical protein
MRLVDGRYECAQCGTVLEIAREVEPKVVFHAASGQPNIRVITIEGQEIHRCEVDDHDPDYPRH